MWGDLIKSLLYMPGGYSMTINFPINMLGGPTKFHINMPSGQCNYETAGSCSGLAALALAWWLWVQLGQGCTWFCGCNPDRVTPSIVGATRTGLHQITWVQAGQGYTQYFLGATRTGLYPFHCWEVHLEHEKKTICWFFVTFTTSTCNDNFRHGFI